MKKFITAFLISVLAITSMAGTVLADSHNQANASVTVTDIAVYGDPIVGHELHIVATVEVTSTATVKDKGNSVSAESTVYATINGVQVEFNAIGLDATVTDSHGHGDEHHGDEHGSNTASVDASQTLEWDIYYTPTSAGPLVLEIGGTADASYTTEEHHHDVTHSDLDEAYSQRTVNVENAPDNLFTLSVGSSVKKFGWIDEQTRVLWGAPSVENTYEGTTIKVSIPAGTTVSKNPYTNFLDVRYVGGKWQVNYIYGVGYADIVFSNPVTITRTMASGQIETLTFTKVVKGVLS